MKLPSLSLLKDKWVLLGLAAGAGVYWFTSHHAAPAHHPMIRPRPVHHQTSPMSSSTDYFPHYDNPGLYQVPAGQGEFSHMRFSGQAELQRRLTIS